MTTQQTQTRTPTEGNGGESQDAIPQEERFSDDAFLRSLRDVSSYLQERADTLDNGRAYQPPVDDHEEVCTEIESVADGGEPKENQVETMTIETEFDEIRADFIRELVDRATASVPNPGKIFSGAVIEMCVDLDFAWKAPGPYSNLPIPASSIPTFEAARMVAIAMNRESIKNKRLSRAVVIRQRGGKYAVKKLATGIPVKSVDPTEDHPCIRFKALDFSQALEEVARFNSTVKKKKRCPKRWHLIVVPINPVE